MAHDPHHDQQPETTFADSAGLTWYQRLFVPELLRGLAVTSRHFIKNLFGARDASPEVVYRKRELGNTVATVQYPEERIPYPPGYRGLHRLVPRDDGKPRCVACYMCATVCPAQCIYIEASEYSDDPIEKFPTSFVIDELRCIVCGLCVEACPKDAIRMDTYVHTPPEYSREGFIYPIERLLKGPAVSYPSDPWVKREDSSQPKDAHFPLHGLAEHSTEAVSAKAKVQQGENHPQQPQFAESDFRK
ncbi:NuoI/complex I 23 kDa subunit family protein [Vulgatibacter incomptus]|uniref:NADH-quinone oxidoreductase subunit I n=1 Tax=Vulgatibacter incomptus TaxID=1391653 RepID=A0A0K1PC44_9BACT|nr:NADH-ubiquinone oxidoreductase chain I [Vulgatibacter incomptus]